MSKIFRAFIDNEQAIRRVLAKYFPRSEDIEELAQETFLKCYAAEMNAEIREPQAFLFRAARNIALSQIKKKSHSTTTYLEDFGSSDVLVDEHQASPEAQLDGRRKLAVLARAIASLPPKDQRMLLMRKMEKLRFKQIAVRMNVSVSTVQKRIAAALVTCNAYLRDSGYDPSEFGMASADTRPADGRSVLAMPTKSTMARISRNED